MDVTEGAYPWTRRLGADEKRAITLGETYPGV